MRIWRDSDIRKLKETVGTCENSVWVVTPFGESFDLKTKDGERQGIKRLVRDTSEQLGFFTANYEDEAKIISFCNRLKVA